MLIICPNDACREEFDAPEYDDVEYNVCPTCGIKTIRGTKNDINAVRKPRVYQHDVEMGL